MTALNRQDVRLSSSSWRTGTFRRMWSSSSAAWKTFCAAVVFESSVGLDEFVVVVPEVEIDNVMAALGAPDRFELRLISSILMYGVVRCFETDSKS